MSALINKTIDFIIPTYDRYHELRAMLGSLTVQTCDNWRATVVVDNASDDRILRVLQDLNHPNIRHIFTGRRFNDWGHTPREMGKQASNCDYIIMTGDDNYYAPVLIEELNRVLESEPDFIYWDMIHSHYGYQFFSCRPAFNQIDMGAFATKAEKAQQITLGTSFAADGEFVEDFRRRFPDAQLIKIDKVLFVHN